MSFQAMERPSGRLAIRVGTRLSASEALACA